MTSQIEKSLLDIDFGSLTRRAFTPSPAACPGLQRLAPRPTPGLKTVAPAVEIVHCPKYIPERMNRELEP